MHPVSFPPCPARTASTLVHPGRWLLVLALLGGAGSPRLAAEVGPDTVRIYNRSTRTWGLLTSSTAWLYGLRALPGADGSPAPLSPDHFVKIAPQAWVDLAWPLSRGRTTLRVPLAPLTGVVGRSNPYRLRAEFRRGPGRLSVRTLTLYPTPPGYLLPCTVDGNILTIHRSTWKDPSAPPAPGTSSPSRLSNLSSSSSPYSSSSSSSSSDVPDAPPPPRFMLPAPVLGPGAGAPSRPHKRKAGDEGEAPAALRARPAPPEAEAAESAAPAPAGLRFVKISNHSSANWFLELAQPFDRHNPVVWKRGRHQPLRPVRPTTDVSDVIDVVGPGREYFRVPAHGRRYLLTALGADPLLARLWDEAQRANPFGIALEVNSASAIPTYNLPDGTHREAATDRQIRKTLRFGPDQITLRTAGWARALVEADPPGTGPKASPVDPEGEASRQP